MSDPLHRALTELIERQRAELDELRPLLEEYQKRRGIEPLSRRHTGKSAILPRPMRSYPRRSPGCAAGAVLSVLVSGQESTGASLAPGFHFSR